MSCTRCGVPVTVASKYCPACGRPVQPERFGAAAVVAPAMAVEPTLLAGAALPGYEPPTSELDAPAPILPPEAPRTNGFAVVSLVMSLIWYFWIGSILALIFGYIAKGQIDASQGQQKGRGFAVAGIAIGWVAVAFLLLFIIVLIVSKPN